MAELAWTENEARSDLSPLEEAYAIQTRMEDFELTQTEVAKTLGMARSTVSNKLRLLELDDEILDQVDDGRISERVASALIPLHRVPEPVREAAEDEWRMDKYDDGYADAVSDQLRKDVRDAINSATTELTGAAFPLDEDLLSLPVIDEVPADRADNVQQGSCDGCPLRFSHDGTDRCGDGQCHTAKKSIWNALLVRRAEDDTGLTCHSSVAWEARSTIESQAVLEHAQRAKQGGADCDLILYEGHWGDVRPIVTVDGDEWTPPCHYACKHGAQGTCACAAAVMAKDDADESAGSEPESEHHILTRIESHLVKQIRPIVAELDAVALAILTGPPPVGRVPTREDLVEHSLDTAKYRLPGKQWGPNLFLNTLGIWREWANWIEDLAAEANLRAEDGGPLWMDVEDPADQVDTPPPPVETIQQRTEQLWEAFQAGTPANVTSRRLKTLRSQIGQRQAWIDEREDEMEDAGRMEEHGTLSQLHARIRKRLTTLANATVAEGDLDRPINEPSGDGVPSDGRPNDAIEYGTINSGEVDTLTTLDPNGKEFARQCSTASLASLVAAFVLRDGVEGEDARCRDLREQIFHRTRHDVEYVLDRIPEAVEDGIHALLLDEAEMEAA
jgi:uncharacterized protein YecT (DUF1311 family)